MRNLRREYVVLHYCSIIERLNVNQENPMQIPTMQQGPIASLEKPDRGVWIKSLRTARNRMEGELVSGV
jgi:hypothetical protein